MTVASKKKVCYCSVIQNGSAERQSSESFCTFTLFRAEHKVSKAANVVGVSRTTVKAIKKRMDDDEGVNRRASSGRKTVVDRDSMRDAI